MDYGLLIIEKAGASLAKSPDLIEKASVEYARLMLKHEAKDRSSTMKWLMAMSVVEEFFKPHGNLSLRSVVL